MAVVWTSTLASVQEPVTSSSATLPVRYSSEPFKKSRPISAVPIRDPRNFFRASGPKEQSLLWRLHLAIQLVKRPHMSDRQVQVILDAISLASPEFFASNDTPTRKSEADHALQALTRRALSAFPHNEAAELFVKIPGAKTEDDILKIYYDISALPLKKRKAAFRNAPSSDKSELWRTHLALFLIRSDFSARQTEIILSAMSLATPEHFEVQSSDPSWKVKVREPLRTLEEQIVSAFSFEDAIKIFATLGDDAELAKSTASVLLRSINYKPLSFSDPLKQWTSNRFQDQGVDLERNGPCQCSTTSDWCPLSSACTGSSCTPTSSGCGTLYTYPCTGASCQ